MNVSFERHSKNTPFQHPLTNGLADTISTEFIYAETIGTDTKILGQYYVRGDPVGSPARKIETIQPSAGPMMVWSIPLSANYVHGCIVFAPKGFAIKRFRHDLALLFTLSMLGDLSERMQFLDYWRDTAGILTGNHRYDNAQGLWHPHERVAVVGCMSDREGHLSDALMKLAGKEWGEVISLERSDALAERVFRKATRLLLRDMRAHPLTVAP